MPDLKTLFHRQDPQTSREAAEKIVKSGKLNKQEDYIYCAILRVYTPINCEFTAKQLSDTTGINYHTIQRRLSGLHNKGRIERIQATDRGELLFYKSGKPIYNKRDGCCVWRLI